MLAGKEAGVVGIMISMGVGLVAGGLASYALKKTYSYWDELERRLESLPRVVKALIDEGAIVWLLFLPIAAAVMAVSQRSSLFNKWPANKAYMDSSCFWDIH